MRRTGCSTERGCGAAIVVSHVTSRLAGDSCLVYADAVTSHLLPYPPTGLFDGVVHRFAVRIYFEDTDLSGVVYHANYLRYMERARSDMLRLAGIDQREQHEAGEGAWAVTDLAIHYRAPARLDDVLTVDSRVTAVRGASVDIAQTIRRDADILTDATITAAFVSPQGRARRQPGGWVAIFRALIAPSDSIASEGNA